MMLKVLGLCAGYGDIPVLTDLSLSLGKGERLGILGHNGMGKTTFLRSLMGFVRAVGGSVVFDGQDITTLPVHRRARLGLRLVPQGREIFPDLTVLENLRMGELSSPRARADSVEEVLTYFPRLKTLLERAGGRLSGGEQQLLALARCLCGHPSLLLLDEPTEGVQPSIVEEIAESLVVISRDRGVAVVVVEQQLDFISAVSDRVLVIRKGRFTRQLGKAELRDPNAVAQLVSMNA
ncbi:ABC transporter ATP-binding protein [Taklimakanibacter deserti]|uniref:ABC transporter ATP-binding protein n=1 Tax=Taklimakanibacter deserti TaxID=2267839 RepID=UPI0034D43132